ncbi:hypothetical protein BY996DRAFT_6765306, partial [Phakopsora pachyrhizi]
MICASPSSFHFSLAPQEEYAQASVKKHPGLLDVAACYSLLKNSADNRPEDLIMRQALEIYCSLISPPVTPSSKKFLDRGDVSCPFNFNQTENLPCSDYPSSPSEPFSSGGSAVEFPSALGYNEDYSPLSSQQLSFSGFSPFFASEPDCAGDLESLDDPFASYHFSIPITEGSNRSDRNLTSYQCARNSGSKLSLNSSSYAYLPALLPLDEAVKDEEGQFNKDYTGPYVTTANLSESGLQSKPPLLQRSSHHEDKAIRSVEQKIPARKRAFSVTSFGLHRKSHSASIEPLIISDPMPLGQPPNLSSRKSMGRAIINGNRTSKLASSDRFSHRKSSEVSLAGCFPATSRTTKAISNPTLILGPGEDVVSRPGSQIFYPKPEPKSLWKTLKTKTSRSSLSIERVRKETYIPDLKHI